MEQSIMSDTLLTVSEDQRKQYRDEGYFILKSAISGNHLQIMQDACDYLVNAMHGEMDRLGVDHLHISHRGKRYHIAKKYHTAPGLEQVVFSDLMADICRATIGDEAYLFYDQYVVKAAEKGLAFSWHQDSGYVGFPHRPYVTCWCAVDDMTVENGTAWIMPFSTIGIRTCVEHVRDPTTGDKAGYFGREPGVAAVVPAGSVVVFSSLTFHRSGPNRTNRMRRAYVTQYSPEPIHQPGTPQPLHLAEPFLKDGHNVHQPGTIS